MCPAFDNLTPRNSTTRSAEAGQSCPALALPWDTLAVMKPLRRVAVLGAGTMGARIAAHFANAGFPVDLLDIVLPDQPKLNAAALPGIENASNHQPVASFTHSPKAPLSPPTFDDA